MVVSMCNYKSPPDQYHVFGQWEAWLSSKKENMQTPHGSLGIDPFLLLGFENVNLSPRQ